MGFANMNTPSVVFQPLAVLSIAMFVKALPIWAAGVQELAESRQLSNAFASWTNSGVLWIDTTASGADLPDGVVIKDFPLLVRITGEYFDFGEAQKNGEDLRFSTSDGKKLAYQIEQWDSARKSAAVWIRIPEVRGNSKQELVAYWGNPTARSESSGREVFNESNGYVSVLHMNEIVRDETGRLEVKDIGTSQVEGMVGVARHFPGGKGVFCGDKITGFPTEASPSTTEAWFRCAVSNARVVGWGNEAPQGKVIMNFRSPPHVQMECYFSGADVSGKIPVAKNEWIHVMHTYQKGESLLYVNGVLDNATHTESAPLNIKSPSRMWLGGWYDVYEYVGDIDEVRVSNTIRSPEWVKLQYENQKEKQTLVGHIVQAGSEFKLSHSTAIIKEGEKLSITARAGGAHKVYWGFDRNGNQEIVGTDRFQYDFEAPRVSQDDSYTLRFTAVYPDKTRTEEIPIKVLEDIPEPRFTLKGPSSWNGRSDIEIVPQILNQEMMEARGAGNLKIRWSTSGLAVLHEVYEGKFVLNRSQNSGLLIVTAEISNGGAVQTQDLQIQVSEPDRDDWWEREPEADERPVENQFFARNENNDGIVHFNGRLEGAADKVFVKLYADEQLVDEQTQSVGDDRRYKFKLRLKPGLIKYRIEFGTLNAGKAEVLERVGNLLCGDAFLIEGQSNAVSTDWGSKEGDSSSTWVRSFGSMEGDTKPGWGDAVRRDGGRWQIGYWGMEVANHIVATQKIPVCIINGAVGGTRIDQHQPNILNRTDNSTIYGRWLARVKQARLTHGIRAVFWHQGEADQGADGPDGGYGCENYQQYFFDMSGGWKRDLPNVQHYYLFQIWPNACSQGGTSFSDKLRDIQRRLPRYYAHMSVMSTLGIKPEGGCHYPAAGYAEMARLMIPLVEQKLYRVKFDKPITAPDLKKAWFTHSDRKEIALDFGQPMRWQEGIVRQFLIDGEEGHVVSGSVSGNVVTLKLKDKKDAKTIGYIRDRKWDSKNLLYGDNEIAALTFADVPISEAK
ncbi:MAG: hypothetical protein RLY14_1528 [Planctomycetota bacterium]|jgi:hypothetical protein